MCVGGCAVRVALPLFPIHFLYNIKCVFCVACCCILLTVSIETEQRVQRENSFLGNFRGVDMFGNIISIAEHAHVNGVRRVGQIMGKLIVSIRPKKMSTVGRENNNAELNKEHKQCLNKLFNNFNESYLQLSLLTVYHKFTNQYDTNICEFKNEFRHVRNKNFYFWISWHLCSQFYTLRHTHILWIRVVSISVLKCQQEGVV